MGRPKKYVNSVSVIPFNGPEALQRQPATLSQITWSEDTIRYGDDDALPYRIAKLVDESPATGSCIDTISQFIQGSRFTSQVLMDLVIDKNGTTLWDFHCMLSDMLALYEGFSVNFKYDGAYQITNAYILNFESCRLKKPDDKGKIHSIKYNPYWGLNEFTDELTIEYPVFDLNNVPREIKDKATGGLNYQGQVYYYGKTSPLYRFYPVPYYWKGKDWIKIDAKIQQFHANNLDNNFLLSVIWNIIGDPNQPSENPKYQETYTDDAGEQRTRSTKTKGEEFTESISTALAGAIKGGAGLGLWSSNHEEATKVTAFPTNSNHDLFNALQDLTTKNVTIATRVPGILANISEGVNLGSTGNEMQKAVEIMQSRVISKQRILTQFYNKILLPNLASKPTDRVEIVNFNPITVPVEIEDKFWDAMDADERRDFIRANVSGVKLKDKVIVTPATTPDGTPLPEGEQPPSTQGNEALKNLGIADINKVQKITKRFELGKTDPSNPKALTLEQAKQFLASYGFTEEQINAWLIQPTEEELTDG